MYVYIYTYIYIFNINFNSKEYIKIFLIGLCLYTYLILYIFSSIKYPCSCGGRVAAMKMGGRTGGLGGRTGGLGGRTGGLGGLPELPPLILRHSTKKSSATNTITNISAIDVTVMKRIFASTVIFSHRIN